VDFYCLPFIVLYKRVDKLGHKWKYCKTAVMDVIGIPCVSLGSSTVQLHDSLGDRRECACSEACFSNQNGDELEDCTTKEQYPVVHFYGQKDSNQRMFPAYSGKCLSYKAIYSRAKKFSQECSKVADHARPGRPVEVTTEAAVEQVEELS
jgi:hypothetical protein